MEEATDPGLLGSRICFFTPTSMLVAVLSAAGLPSHSGRSADGGARSSPSTQRAAALGEATQADLCGSISLGPFVAVLERLGVGPGHRVTGDGDCLASGGCSQQAREQDAFHKTVGCNKSGDGWGLKMYRGRLLAADERR